MDATIFFYFVLVLAILYTGIVRILQNKLMDKHLMNEVQEKSRKINALYKEAANDKRKMDEITKMNQELMPKMNAMLFNQMKMMAVILALFFAFTWITGQADSYGTDDFSINLSKNSENYSGAFVLNNASNGLWYVTVYVYEKEQEIGMNQTVFFAGPKKDEIIWKQVRGIPISVYTEKEIYTPGETVKIYATPEHGDKVVAFLNGGTRFYVDLPFTIPLLNLRRIYDSQSWFIFCAVIIGLLYSLIDLIIKKFALIKRAEVL